MTVVDEQTDSAVVDDFFAGMQYRALAYKYKLDINDVKAIIKENTRPKNPSRAGETRRRRSEADAESESEEGVTVELTELNVKMNKVLGFIQRLEEIVDEDEAKKAKEPEADAANSNQAQSKTSRFDGEKMSKISQTLSKAEEQPKKEQKEDSDEWYNYKPW